MTETVTDIIVARSRSQEKLTSVIVWSLGLHAAVIAGLIFVPAAKEEPPRAVMTISLSGSEGPRTAGLTQAGAQPIREATPPEVKPKPVAPPKEKIEMTIPDPKAKTRVDTKPRPAPEAAAPSPSVAPAPTRVRGQGFGLSTSGGRGLSGVQVDEAANFCCIDYVTNDVVEAIRMHWNNDQRVPGSNVMKFTIRRDGTLQQIQLEQPSGLTVLDNESQHALLTTIRVPPLPKAYPNATLTVHLRFEY